MKMLDTHTVDEMVLALLWLNQQSPNRAWKSLNWDALSRLHKKGMIGDPVSHAKTVEFTENGLREAGRLASQYFIRPKEAG